MANRSTRNIYLSTYFRASGNVYDFVMDLPSAAMEMPPHCSTTADADSTLDGCITQVVMPLPPLSLGRLTRIPSCMASTGNNLQVVLFRLHSTIMQDNKNVRGDSSVLLQVPFMSHYSESQDLTDPRIYAKFTYDSPSETTAMGKFRILGGLHSLRSVRFWITDEMDRLFMPAGDWHFVLSLTASTAAPQRKTDAYLMDMDRCLRTSLQLQRLALFQATHAHALPGRVHQTASQKEGGTAE